MKTRAYKISLSVVAIFALVLVCGSLVSGDSLTTRNEFPGGGRASVTLDLVKITGPTNVDDTEGRWQFDGGEVYNGSSLVGAYIRKRRVSFGCYLNAAAVTLTILVDGQDPPQNITIGACHSFSAGGQIGSVSAASSAFSWLIGADVSGTYNAVTLTW